MAKRSKIPVYDGDTGLPVDSSDGDPKAARNEPFVKLNDMLLRAFVDAWEPVEADESPDDKMYLIDLRTHFQCYTTDDSRCVDLLPYYLDELKEYGFELRVDFMFRQYMPVKSVHKLNKKSV